MSQVFGFASSYALIVLAPGPNLAVVLLAALGWSRRTALITALGVACGAGCLAALIMGASVLVPMGGVPFQSFAVIYGLFLMHLGGRSLRRPHGAAQGLEVPSGVAGFQRGFLTAIGNPFTAVFFATAAVAVDPVARPVQLPLMVAAVPAVSGAWFVVTALCAASARGGACHRRIVSFADPLIGVALIGFGAFAVLRSLRHIVG